MNDTSKFQKKWETGQENEERVAILETPITFLEISRKPESTMNETSKFQKKWETGQKKEEREIS